MCVGSGSAQSTGLWEKDGTEVERRKKILSDEKERRDRFGLQMDIPPNVCARLLGDECGGSNAWDRRNAASWAKPVLDRPRDTSEEGAVYVRVCKVRLSFGGKSIESD